MYSRVVFNLLKIVESVISFSTIKLTNVDIILTFNFVATSLFSKIPSNSKILFKFVAISIPFVNLILKIFGRTFSDVLKVKLPKLSVVINSIILLVSILITIPLAFLIYPSIKLPVIISFALKSQHSPAALLLHRVIQAFLANLLCLPTPDPTI